MSLSKIVRLGATRCGDVFCKIKIEAGKLSISGVEGPARDGGCRGSCGQIGMSLRDAQDTIKLAPAWDRAMLARFFAVWERWHLNDMRAGSAVQEQYLRDSLIPKEDYAYPKSHYDVASAKLAAAGLNPDADGYRYGRAWKREELPADVIAFLQSLPDTDKAPAWV